MKNFKKWLWAVSLSPIFVLFGSDIGLPKEISTVYLFSTLIYPFLISRIYNKISLTLKKHFAIHVISLSLIFTNILLSIDPSTSLFYWFIYLFFIYGMNCWILLLKKEGEFPYLLSFLKVGLDKYLINSILIIFIALTIFNFGNGKTFNSLGIITGSTIAYVWFKNYNKIFYKPIILFILIFILLTSLSRSSLIFVILTILVTELILLNKDIKRKGTIFIALIILITFYSENLLNWFSLKQFGNSKAINKFSNLLSLNEDRSVLIDMFLKVFKDIFYTGYGIDTPYQELVVWNQVDNVGIHNGILEMVLLLGVPLAIIFFYYFIVSFKKIIKLTSKNKSYATILGFVMYCLLRSYGESYFLLNIGNTMSVLFLIILILLYNHKIISEKKSRK